MEDLITWKLRERDVSTSHRGGLQLQAYILLYFATLVKVWGPSQRPHTRHG
jgi:hypothetical protein